jgi:RND family efflux transporter MFP subunit
MSLELSAPSSPQSRALRDAFERLETLRVFQGAPAQFWPAFLQITTALAPAVEAVLLTRQRGPEESGAWREAFCWPSNSQLGPALRTEKGDLERLALAAEGDGAGALGHRPWIAVRLATGETQRSAIVVARLDPGADREEALTRLRLLADAPLLYQLGRGLEQARQDMARFAVVLDVMTLLNAQTRYMGAAMTLCNELASRYRCERVSLGWLERGYVRLQAMSHTEKFERRMAIATALEGAMDEALDQDEEIAWPAATDSTAVARDHEAFARAQGIGSMLSLPIRDAGKPAGVLTLERAAGQPEFSTQEAQTLRLLCDHAARRLAELKRHDRWFGARFGTWLREQSARLLGPEHTVAKLIALAIAATLAVLFFGRAEYRVEAPFILKTDVLAQVPAPFEGYLDEVHVRVGDAVRAGQPLLALDTRELLLQEAAALAERARFLAEAQKAESDNDVAQMRIAQASAEEAGARLELARHHLAQAQVRAPFDGVVIEGDLRERLSAPVKQGEVLVKVAKLDAIYAEVAMPERDVHEIRAGQRGEIAFASRPQFTFPMQIERVEPAAEVREQGNAFTVRASCAATEPWWRPGMSGVAKVNAGTRNLFWIITHRTVDFLRLWLWW